MLRPGGKFITQQVGGRHTHEINDWFGQPPEYGLFTLETVLFEVTASGLDVLDSQESLRESHFYDIGAIVYYLRAAPWQVPGFTVEGYRNQLAAIHNHIQETGRLSVTSHGMFVEAVKPLV